MPLPGSPSWIDPKGSNIEILSRDLSRYNIYLWEKGKKEANHNADVVKILSLPSLKVQVENQDRMTQYFMDNGKMNEIARAKKQIVELGKSDRSSGHTDRQPGWLTIALSGL